MASRRVDRMYSKSPRIERNEEGRAVVTRDPARNKEEPASFDGIEVHHKQAKDRASLYQKHEQEHLDLTLKHSKENTGKTQEQGDSNEAG